MENSSSGSQKNNNNITENNMEIGTSLTFSVQRNQPQTSIGPQFPFANYSKHIVWDNHDAQNQLLVIRAPYHPKFPVEPDPIMGLHVVLPLQRHRLLRRRRHNHPPLPYHHPPEQPSRPARPNPGHLQPLHGSNIRRQFPRHPTLGRRRDPRHTLVLEPH